MDPPIQLFEFATDFAYLLIFPIFSIYAALVARFTLPSHFYFLGKDANSSHVSINIR